jgi:hypothetical protein
MHLDHSNWYERKMMMDLALKGYEDMEEVNVLQRLIEVAKAIHADPKGYDEQKYGQWTVTIRHVMAPSATVFSGDTRLMAWKRACMGQGFENPDYSGPE